MLLSRVLVDEENGMSSANLIRNEFMTRKTVYAMERSKRVQAVVTSALNAFSGGRIAESSDGLVDKCINISVEGRITLLNVPPEYQ